MEINQTEEFNLAYRFVTETNQNVFLTGKAGTGKTTFLKYLRQNSRKNMVVAAPTGVAAINAGGVTLHSLFQLPFAPFIPSRDSKNPEAVNSHSLLSQIHYNKNKLDLLRNLELLIIDETSMVASHSVDAIDTILRSLRRRYQEPFGGIQVLFIGDLHQLPPVVKNEEWSFLKDYYSSIFFFDSLVLKENIPVMVELKKIYRQQDNAFIEILNGIRNNNLTPQNFERLNSRRVGTQNFVSAQDGYITLTTHNYQADAINNKKLMALNAPKLIYQAIIEGSFPEHIYPAEQNLELKEGAQVMFLKNDTETKKYFNGKIGTITVLEKEMIKVKCKGEEEEIEVKSYEWKNMNYSLNPNTRQIVEEELGSFRQYPLRLAWAITIHKSQGLTFDKLIIDAENAFANGQVYVALSRCTSLEGLILTSPVNQRFLGAHQNLTEWTEKNQDEKNLKNRFEEARQVFIQKELQQIFTWRNWFYELKELHDVMNENIESLSPECFTWIEKLTHEQKALEDIAGKFKDYMLNAFKQNADVETNEALQKRIKDAATYFSNEIGNWKDNFYKHPLRVKTRKVSHKVDVPLQEVFTIVNEILRKIEICKNGFILNNYLEQSKKKVGPIEKIASSYSNDKKEDAGSENTSKSITHSENPNLYMMLSSFRKEKANKMNQPVYRIFSNQALKGICDQLPADTRSLRNIKGIGDSTLEQYGKEVLAIILQYCTANNIEPNEVQKPQKTKLKVTDTVEETLRIFKSGKTIAEIAKERNFAEGTIESHLARAIENNAVNIEELMPIDEVHSIAKYFTPAGEEINLSGIKERVPADVSYGKLRMVLAWLQKA